MRHGECDGVLETLLLRLQVDGIIKLISFAVIAGLGIVVVVKWRGLLDLDISQ